jgi:hypothetical protein
VPIQKFRSVYDMPPVPAPTQLEGDGLRRLAKLWSFAAKLTRRPFGAGVYKYKSLEEARAAREAARDAAVEAALTPILTSSSP